MKLYLMISACLLLLAGCTATVTVDNLDGGVNLVNNTGGYLIVTVNSESPVRIENGNSLIKVFGKNDPSVFVWEGLFCAKYTNDYVLDDNKTNTLSVTANRGAIRLINGGGSTSNYYVTNVSVYSTLLQITNTYNFSTPLTRGNYVDFVVAASTWTLDINHGDLNTGGFATTVGAKTNIIVGENPADGAGSPVFLNMQATYLVQ
ncbi:MAG: hypothetical protein HZC28_07845 [Spirochaetes bacterium]|nr:hypothetical protein [Spirochaetota bacterium]